MRKQIVREAEQQRITDAWLNIDQCASVALTSEDPDYPIESALSSIQGPGWRAHSPGTQRLTIVFDSPQRIRRIRLEFIEPSSTRTQEFVLRWSGGDQLFHEIVRQQWNFSPPNAIHEIEDYRTDLTQVATLELAITPDIHCGDAIATLASLKIA